MKSTITPTADPRPASSLAPDPAADAEGADDAAATTPAAPRELVTLSVTVDEAEFDADIEQAFRKIARQVNLPGFRNGKAPRKVLEARIGVQAARDEALRDAIPQYLAAAVREHDVDLVATPEITITGGEESGDVTFDALCEVRPVITVPGYGGLRVELPNPAATETEITEAIDAERRRQGSLVDAGRVAAHGDHLTIDLAATRAGEPVPGLNTEDWLYELGKGWVADGFDDQLTGAAAGATLEFSLTPRGTSEAADFAVTVKSVQVLELPEVTDDWVAEHLGEFDTVEAWRASIAERLGSAKLNQARNQFVERTTAALAALVEAPVPDSMVGSDLQRRVQNTVQQFQAQGIQLEQWLQLTGQSTSDFLAALREQSLTAVKVDLALRAVATAEGLEVTDDDIEVEYERIAQQVRQKVDKVKKAYEQNDAVSDLVASIRATKAIDWLLEHVEVVDPDGAPIDRALLLGRDHDHDHDHDHEH